MKIKLLLACLIPFVAAAANERWTVTFEAQDDIFGPHPLGATEGVIGAVVVEHIEAAPTASLKLTFEGIYHPAAGPAGWIPDYTGDNTLNNWLQENMSYSISLDYLIGIVGREVAVSPQWRVFYEGSWATVNGSLFVASFGEPVTWEIPEPPVEPPSGGGGGEPPPIDPGGGGGGGIPEPGTYALLFGLGLAGFAGYRRVAK